MAGGLSRITERISADHQTDGGDMLGPIARMQGNNISCWDQIDGTLHFAPVSPRHSFDFSHVNTSHHIDHLSFGLELASSKRAASPRY